MSLPMTLSDIQGLFQLLESGNPPVSQNPQHIVCLPWCIW